VKYLKCVAPTVNSEVYVDTTNLERKKYNLDADMCEAYKIEILNNILSMLCLVRNSHLNRYQLIKWH